MKKSLDLLEKIFNDEKYYKKIKKNILQFDKNNNYISTYDTLIEIERELKIDHGNISACLHNKRKSAGGYIWKYEYKYILENLLEED